MRAARYRRRWLIAGVFVASLVGCSDRHPVGPNEMASLVISASVTATPISTLAIEVTAPDIATVLIFNIEIVAGTASGTITIPAGSARTLTVRGFDTHGVETHRGSITINVQPGTNPAVHVTLLPLSGNQPIEVTISSVLVTVTPSSATIQPSQTMQLSAAITDASGNPVAGQVAWATLNPAFATVSQVGLVTGVAVGQVQIVATFGGVGGYATITVSDATQPAGGSISASLYHTCGVAAGGAAYCWGGNFGGQLGDGTTTGRTSPVAVSGGLSFTAVSAGGSHTCGLTAAGAAYCWGSNFVGALGDGTTIDQTSPVAVSGGLTFAALSAGTNSYTCGVTAAGAAYCWGGNGYGQLGDGTTTERHGPTAVSGGLTFAAVRADGDHSCGLTTAGAAYCWGSNTVGQLGNGTTTNSTSPVAVSGGLTFVALSAGFGHNCGLAAGGAAYCWGDNAAGQLGDGTTTQRTSPVAVSGGLTFVALSAGVYHTCGVTPGGAAYCWGDNPFGELGDGTTTSRTSPTAVSGGLTFASVSTGQNYTCGVTIGGAAYCWGYNGYGNLGDGTTTDRTTPALVSGGLSFP